jgi:hypothetical protein
VSIEYRTQIESWRALRNQAVHSSAAITTEQARSMVQNIREFGLGGDSGAELSGDIPQLARSIKGKYAHIRTSTNEFIARKRDDLELEDR